MGKFLIYFFVVFFSFCQVCYSKTNVLLSNNLDKDSTSYIYHFQEIDVNSFPFLSFSASEISPNDKRVINSSSFGIRAKFVQVQTPEYERIHIDLNKDRIKEEYPWQVFFPVLICVILILLAKFYSDGYISRLFLIIFYKNAFLNAISEKNVNADKAGYMLFSCFLLNVVLTATVCLYRYNYQFSIDFIISYIGLLAIASIYYFVIKLITNAFSQLFAVKEIFVLYYKDTDYLVQAASIVLTILNTISLYVVSAQIHEIAFYATVLTYVLVEIIKIFKLFLIIIEKRFPIFYLFLYLCGVEFLPAVLAVKLLSEA